MIFIFTTTIICITLLALPVILHTYPICIKIYKSFERIHPQEAPITDDEKKAIEEQNALSNGLNEVIRFTQDFLGGDIDANDE